MRRKNVPGTFQTTARYVLVSSLLVVIGVLLLLTPGKRAQADLTAPHALPTPWHARLPSAPYPGIWHFLDLDLDALRYPDLVGTHRVWGWKELNPAPGVYRWDDVDRWIDVAVAGGKPVALGVNTYDGIYDGGDLTPRWVYEQYPQAQLVCPDGWTLPKYWDPHWQQALETFVAAFAARYDGDPRIAWVEIGVGVYGETAPVSSSWHRQHCLVPAGLTSTQWIQTVNAITDIYTRNFQHTQLFLQMAPAYLNWWERREFVNHAAEQGVGLKHNGLQAETGTAVFGPCPQGGSSCESGVVELMRAWGDRVPIAWEGDPRYFRPRSIGADHDEWIPTDHPEWAVYWQILNALDKHSDYILYNRWLAQLPQNRYLFRWANQYLGRTIFDTPSVWVVLRDTKLPNYRYPQRGNFSFWLYQQNDVTGGRTVPVWDVGPYPQGYYARRTDESTGNRYMYFDVDDVYMFNGNARDVRVRVTYLDRGYDTWALEYDGRYGVYTQAGIITKENSGEWQTVEFFLPDARFADLEEGGTDFRIDSRNDGDEIIHFVEVVRSPYAEPTPTPTRVLPPHFTPTPTPGAPIYELELQQERDGYMGVMDTYISKAHPSVNYGDQETLSLCPICPRQSDETRHILIRFDLNGVLPPQAEVKYAWLALYSTDGTGNLYARAYQLLRPWNEQGATWNQAMLGQTWATPGANAPDVDRANTWLDQGTAQDKGRWMIIDVTRAVRQWLRQPVYNFGLVLIPFNLGASEYSFASSEYNDPTKHPLLRIGYVVPQNLTPTPTPTPSPTPTPTPTPTPVMVYWVIGGRVYDALGGPDMPIAGSVVTLTLGSELYRWTVHSDERGVFSLIARAPDAGNLYYEATAPEYLPASGTLPERTPRQYVLNIPLQPRYRRVYIPHITQSRR